MKIALCLSGQAREFKRSYPSIKANILDRVDTDIFAYLWQPIKQPFWEIEGAIRYPDEGSLDEFKELYKPTVFAKEVWDTDREAFFDNPRFSVNKHPFASIIRYQAMIYMIWNANRIKNEYEERWSKHYDVVIKARSDLEITNEINAKELEDARENDVVYCDRIAPDGRILDIMFFGNKFVMDKMCDLWNCYHLYHASGVIFDTEIMMPHHITKNRFEAKEHSMKPIVLRPPQAKW